MLEKPMHMRFSLLLVALLAGHVQTAEKIEMCGVASACFKEVDAACRTALDAGLAAFRMWQADFDATAIMPSCHKCRIDYGGGGMTALHRRLTIPHLRSKARPKLFEIGLGVCHIGPGLSLHFWRTLAPMAEVWVGEYDGVCIQKLARSGGLWGAQALQGDQSNHTDLRRWVDESGGNFDIVVDDGSHRHDHILASLRALWPALKRVGCM